MDSDSADSASQPPAKPSEVDSSPARAPDTEPPAEASMAVSPDKVSGTEPAAEASDTKSPAKASDTKSLAKASNSDSLAKASNTEHPTKVLNAEEASHRTSDVELTAATQTGGNFSARESPLSMLSPSNISSRTKTSKFPQPVPAPEENSQTGSAGMSPFARFTSELGLRLPSVTPAADKSAEGTSTTNPGGVLESFTKGLVDSSRNAVKAVQGKARHIVSQNK